MNKESIEKRIQDLQAGQAQSFNEFQAYSGAIQDCKHWLSQLEKDNTEEKTDG